MVHSIKGSGEGLGLGVGEGAGGEDGGEGEGVALGGLVLATGVVVLDVLDCGVCSATGGDAKKLGVSDEKV